MGDTIEVGQQGPHFTDPGAPVYVVTGGGGEHLWQDLSSLQSFTMARERAFHLTRITIDRYVLTIQPVLEDGTLLDLSPGLPGTASTITKTPGRPFRRGDSNQNHNVDLSDVVFTLSWLFQGGPPPHCLDAADADDSGAIDLTDPIRTLGHLFLGTGPLPSPGADGCGDDPTSDALDCLEFPPCTECRCDDGVDNDGDGDQDCVDADCTGLAGC